MDRDLKDLVDGRVRDARPAEATVDRNAFDADLLARITASDPVAPRPPRRLALPAAALAALAVAVVLVLAGWPAATHVPRPDDAAGAMRRAAIWFSMPAGKVLHYRSIIHAGRAGATQELWQSTDDPNLLRRAESSGGGMVEVAGGGDLYDPARNKIYVYVEPTPRERASTIRRQMDRKIAAARAGGAGEAVMRRLRSTRNRLLRQVSIPASARSQAALGDPLVETVHRELEAGRATVGAQVRHDGVAARPIASRVYGNSVRWVLWTAVADGRPLELATDHGPGTAVVESTVYRTYELLPADGADRLVTLRGAHPGATVVRSPRAFRAAEHRLFRRG